MSNKEKKSTYKVGYKKPPKHSQFQPGSQGNAKGRPKGSKNLTTIVTNAINEKVAVTENGKRKMVSKLEVAVKQLVNKAAGGDQKAIMQLLPLVQLVEGRAEAAETVSGSVLAESDQQVLSSIRKRLERHAIPEPTTQSPQSTPSKEK